MCGRSHTGREIARQLCGRQNPGLDITHVGRTAATHPSEATRQPGCDLVLQVGAASAFC
jgi:hypothetical protein